MKDQHFEERPGGILVPKVKTTPREFRSVRPYTYLIATRHQHGHDEQRTGFVAIADDGTAWIADGPTGVWEQLKSLPPRNG